MPTVLRLEEGATCRCLKAAVAGEERWPLLMVTGDACRRPWLEDIPVRISTEDDLFSAPEDDDLRTAPPAERLSAMLQGEKQVSHD